MHSVSAFLSGRGQTEPSKGQSRRACRHVNLLLGKSVILRRLLLSKKKYCGWSGRAGVDDIRRSIQNTKEIWQVSVT